MSQERVSTVRLPSAVRTQLKAMAATRRMTMEAAIAEAVLIWLEAPVVRPQLHGRMSERERRMHAKVAAIVETKGDQIVQATICVLDGMLALPQ